MTHQMKNLKHPHLIKYLSVSDIHNLHKKNPPKRMHNAMMHYFKVNKVKDMDIIFLGGDVFDRLGDIWTIRDVLTWIAWLINFCRVHDIILRALNGTPSHDRGQNEFFQCLSTGSNIDIKIIDTVAVERILGMDVLFVPDEWSDDPEVVYREAVRVITEAGLTKVDIAQMHCLFDYQLPANIPNLVRHDEDNYRNICRYYIHVGHIHKHEPNNRIIPNNSFDRLRHNEEDPKGAVFATINLSTKEHSYRFVENKLAMKFITYTIDDKPFKQQMGAISKVMSTLETGEHLALKGDKDNPIIRSVDDIRRKYPTINVTTNTGTKKPRKINNTGLLKDVIINNENIVDVFKEHLNKRGYDKTLTNEIMYEFEFMSEKEK